MAKIPPDRKCRWVSPKPPSLPTNGQATGSSEGGSFFGGGSGSRSGGSSGGSGGSIGSCEGGAGGSLTGAGLGSAGSGWGSAGRGLGIKASTLKERRKFTRRGLVSGSVTFRTLARGPLVSPTDPKQDLCHFNIDVYLRQLRISAVRIFVEIGTKHVRISTVLDAVPEGELTFGDFSIRCG